MVLHGQLCGRVGRRRSLFKMPLREFLEAAFLFDILRNSMDQELTQVSHYMREFGLGMLAQAQTTVSKNTSKTLYQ